MNEKLFSQSITVFARNMFFCLLLSCFTGKMVWAALMRSMPYLIIFKKSLDAGMESSIVQLDFSAAFGRMSHGGLLFKLKSIGVGSSVLSICRIPLQPRADSRY